MFTGASLNVGAEAGKNKKPEEWTNRCNTLIKSTFAALSVLYDGLESDEEFGITNIDPKKDSELQVETIPVMAETFIQHCQKLVCMLSESTNGPVRLPLGLVLNTVSRCLRVSYADVKSVPSMSELAGLLPALHRAALEILAQLVLCCKTSLLPRSRVIIDMCLQALVSSRHMNISDKSQTKACAYQVLCLVVQMFGWGRYLTHQSKSLIQELIMDIKWQNSAKHVSADQPKQEIVQGNKKKGQKKKKKSKGESYSGLVKTNVVAGERSSGDDVTSNFEATIGALELSKLMLGRAEFLSVESLVRSILDTTQTIQQEWPPAGSPYTKSLCRQALYSAVFACSTVKLDPGYSRKDSITHFQMTNLALSLLNDGKYKEHCPEVQAECKNSLNILLVTGNLERPIVRRNQPDENQNVTKDVTELEREIETIREEYENIQKRLIDSELETQTQKRLVASLRKEMDTLKERKTETITPCADQKVYLTDPTDYRLLSDDADKEDFQENEFEAESDDEKQESTKITKKLKRVPQDEDLHDQTSTVSDSVASSTHADDSIRESPDGHSKLGKRKSPDDESCETLEKRKKSKIDNGTNNNITDADSIQDMISDFVDAGPDNV